MKNGKGGEEKERGEERVDKDVEEEEKEERGGGENCCVGGE
jgi:hypothetical protein